MNHTDPEYHDAVYDHEETPPPSVESEAKEDDPLLPTTTTPTTTDNDGNANTVPTTSYTDVKNDNDEDARKKLLKAKFQRAARAHVHQARAQNFMKTLRETLASPFMSSDKPIKRVEFDATNHISVLFQMHGSVWPSVLPFCLINVLITYCVCYGERHGIDTTFPSNGHSFMSIMVSFLIIARAQITYARFMEARNYLSVCYRACREMMHHVAVLTMQERGDGAKQWRQDVAYRTILLLRVTMAAIEFQSSSINTWDVLPEGVRDTMELFVAGDGSESGPTPGGAAAAAGAGGGGTAVKENYFSVTPEKKRIMKWAHGQRTLSDENFRAPIVLAYNLRTEIMKQRNGQYLEKEMHVNEELKILGFVSDFISAFHGLKKLITTPFPFPLVQMARTFLFFWVFTLPFALADDIHEPVQEMIIIFFITYGFIGLEYVSMELEDPFGDDPNDFDDLGMAQMVFEDIYITIYKTDGARSATELRGKISDRIQQGSALDNYRRDIAHDVLVSHQTPVLPTVAET